MNKQIALPAWLDHLVFEKYGGRYARHPEEVQYNPDKDSDFVKDYLGTYFPRSFAEGYCIVGQLLENPRYYRALLHLEEIRILDFCCGTGGEIFGLISILKERFPALQRIIIDAFDANVHAIRLLNKLAMDATDHYSGNTDIMVNPQCVRINGNMNLDDIVNHTHNVKYHFIISFKAINEFIQHDTFPDENVYRKISGHFLPSLDDNGLMIISDLSHKTPYGQYYPRIMNTGMNGLAKSAPGFRTVYPYPCYFHERKCQGCYMQDRFYVSHSGIDVSDITKIAYRAMCHSGFADMIMSDISPRSCLATIGYSVCMAHPYQQSFNI